jgi:hypothetical protein
LHSVLTRENPRLLSTYKTDRSNRKQDKTAGLRPGRTIVKQDWDTTAGLWPDQTGTRLPAYGRTRLLTYGQTRLLGKTILQNYAGHSVSIFASIRVDLRRVDANRRKLYIDASYTYAIEDTRHAHAARRPKIRGSHHQNLKLQQEFFFSWSTIKIITIVLL